MTDSRSPTDDPLTPTPDFARFLEWQVAAELRRATRFGAGGRSDRLALRRPLAAGVVLVAASLALGACGVLAVQEVVWADYFGRLHLGAVRSTGIPFTIVSSAGGPLFAGWVYDSTGNYTIAFSVFIAALLLGCVLIWLAPKPSKPAAGASR